MHTHKAAIPLRHSLAIVKPIAQKRFEEASRENHCAVLSSSSLEQPDATIQNGKIQAAPCTAWHGSRHGLARNENWLRRPMAHLRSSNFHFPYISRRCAPSDLQIAHSPCISHRCAPSDLQIARSPCISHRCATSDLQIFHFLCISHRCAPSDLHIL